MAYARTPEKQAALEWAVEQTATHPNRTVARMMLDKYPSIWSDIETARTALRIALGAHGDADRPQSLVEPRISTIAEGLKKLADNKPKEPELQMGPGEYLVISDLHVPHHDSEALSVALQYGLDNGFDQVIINGDFLDCYSVSKFNRDPSHIPLREELLRANVVLDMIQDLFDTVAYKFGNHERRFKDYIKGQAKELDGLVGLTLAEQLRLDERGIEYRINEPIWLGKLPAFHGDELARGPFSPVLPARSAMDKTRGSVIVGHHHRTSEMIKGSASGDLHGGWGLGCLCSLYPEYNPTAYLDWNHGFATVSVDEDLSFTVSNKRIIKGKVR